MIGILRRVLEREGYHVEITQDPQKGLDLVRGERFDIILSDLKMPGTDGMEILKNTRVLQPGADFIMMTAYATVQTAVESMKLGAFDYLIKPFPVEDLKVMIRRILESKELGPPEDAGSGNITHTEVSGFHSLIHIEEGMKAVIRRAEKVAKSDVSVLIRGESGTGKEVLAKAIHSAGSRAAKPFITINCGAIPENLLESELFGHKRGAFTGAVESKPGLFQMAHTGTVFLDEVGELPLNLQVKILRVLQEGEFLCVGDVQTVHVDVRIIAATNRNLEVALEDGTFRQDLFYRLNVVPIEIPPLRRRPGDIAPLVKHFLKEFEKAARPIEITPESMRLLQSHNWPGNVRELQNAVEHAAVLCENNIITPADLPDIIQHGSEPGEDISSSATNDPLTLEDMERRSIVAALTKTGGNQTRAARILGITRRTLGYRMKKYNIETW